MSAPLELTLKDPDPWFVAKQAFDLISDSVQPDSPIYPAQVVAQVDSLTPGRRVLQDGEQAEEPASFLLSSGRFSWLLRGTPYDHPAQERLVELVDGLEKLSSGSYVATSENAKSIWLTFERLDNVLDDVWNEPTEMEDSYEPYREWVNLNSFVARLFAEGFIDWHRYRIWTMRDSLEASDATPNDVRESRVTVATQWIAHSALALFKIMTDKNATDGDRRYLRSPAFSGDKVIPLERWNFWKDMLQRVADTDISPKVRQMASRAVIAMDDGEIRYGPR